MEIYKSKTSINVDELKSMDSNGNEVWVTEDSDIARRLIEGYTVETGEGLLVKVTHTHTYTLFKNMQVISFGLHSKITEWKAFLSDKQYKVTINQNFRDGILSKVVSHRDVLGPFLFIMYVNELPFTRHFVLMTQTSTSICR